MTPEEILANKIKKSKLTQTRIAKRANVSKTLISHYANQRINLQQIKNIKSVCDTIGIELGELVDEEVKPSGHVTIEDLTYKIEDWFYDRNLHNQEPSKQFLKVAEEVGELGGALARQDEALITDALGDVFVTLIGIAMQTDIDFTAAVQSAYNEIKDRKGKLVGGVFVKEEKQ